MVWLWGKLGRVHPNLSRFTVSSIIRTFRLENRYVFNSLLSTLLRLYLEYLQYCTISHVLYCRVANAPFWTKVVVLWLPTLRCFSTFYGIYSKVQYIQYCKNEANQYSNISWLLFSIEWLEDLLGSDANACSPNSRNLPLWTWSEQTMQSVSTSYSSIYLQIEKYSIA